MTFTRRDCQPEEVNLLKKLLFPRCWNAHSLFSDRSEVQDRLPKLGALFHAGAKYYSEGDSPNPSETVDGVLDMLPAIRNMLKKDVETAYQGDPAATSYTGIIRAYPGFRAIMIQRTAHAHYNVGIAEYARELTEYAKADMGINVHPGAKVGEYFFIDHGTGVVIGETTTIGNWVRIYQNVTLGALHFEEEEDEENMLKKGDKRHSDIGDHVVIGTGSKVLGPIRLGDQVSIGANSWVTEDVPNQMNIFISSHPKQERKQKSDLVPNGSMVTLISK